MVPQLALVKRSPGQRAALQEPVLRLVVVARLPVLLHHRLKVDDIGFFVLDQYLGAGFEKSGGRERVDDDQAENDYEAGNRHPTALGQDLHIVEQVHPVDEGLSVTGPSLVVATNRTAGIAAAGSRSLQQRRV
jgi:hypothetical protein